MTTEPGSAKSAPLKESLGALRKTFDHTQAAEWFSGQKEHDHHIVVSPTNAPGSNGSGRDGSSSPHEGGTRFETYGGAFRASPSRKSTTDADRKKAERVLQRETRRLLRNPKLLYTVAQEYEEDVLLLLA